VIINYPLRVVNGKQGDRGLKMIYFPAVFGTGPCAGGEEKNGDSGDDRSAIAIYDYK
jgi:hypothetical protein